MRRRITTFGSVRKRTLAAVAAALATTVLASLLQIESAAGSVQAKAFPPGCWIGQRPYTGSYTSGPVKAKVENGKLKIVLWVGTGKAPAAVGFMTITGVGVGSLAISGSELALEVNVSGDYDLTGTAASVKVNGTFSMTGTAIGAGQFGGTYPVKTTLPLKGALLTIQTASATTVTGHFGTALWSVNRHGGAPSKTPTACAKAG